MTAEPGGRLPMPPSSPGIRLRLLYAFHRDLCQRRHGRLPADHSGEALCWKALRATDEALGDVDELVDDLNRQTARIRADNARSEGRQAKLEEALGVGPTVIIGEAGPELR